MEDSLDYRAFMALAEFYGSENSDESLSVEDVVNKWSHSPPLTEEMDFSDEEAQDGMFLNYFIRRHLTIHYHLKQQAEAFLALMKATKGKPAEWGVVQLPDAMTVLAISSQIEQANQIEIPDTLEEINWGETEINEDQARHEALIREKSARMKEWMGVQYATLMTVVASSRGDEDVVHRYMAEHGAAIFHILLNLITGDFLDNDPHQIMDWANHMLSHLHEMKEMSDEELAELFDDRFLEE